MLTYSLFRLCISFIWICDFAPKFKSSRTDITENAFGSSTNCSESFLLQRRILFELLLTFTSVVLSASV
jgi:hypothetical protein